MGEMHLLREAHFPRPRLPQTGNLISDVPDVRWYTDITYIETTDFGKGSFIEIEGSCTRDIRTWDFPMSCDASEAFAVVEDAVMGTFPSGRVHCSRLKTEDDNQLTSTTVRDGCSLLCITLEAIKKRNPEGRTRISPLTAMFCCSSQPEGARSLAILK